MNKNQSARLDRTKFFADPVLVVTVFLLIALLVLFVLYPLVILLVDSFLEEGHLTGEIFERVLHLRRFKVAFWNTLLDGVLVGVLSTLIGLLFAYVDVYVSLRSKILEKIFNLVALLPVVSPPFVLSLSMICLFGRAGFITKYLLGIRNSNIYGLGGLTVVQTMTLRTSTPRWRRPPATWARAAGRCSRP